jgi:hypothetical protein
MMTTAKIKDVKRELTRLAQLIELLESEESACGNCGDYYSGSKESGAVRRASMDLTRALADLCRSR